MSIDHQRVNGEVTRISRREVLRRCLVGGAATAAGGLLLSACGGSSAAAPAASGGAASAAASGKASSGATGQAASQAAPVKGGELRYGFSVEPTTLDPHRATTAFEDGFLIQMYDTLVDQDSSAQRFKPSLAQSWQSSSDGLTHTFKLRTDVKFHDGTPFDAAAVKFNFDRIVDPATKAGSALSTLGPYERTEVVDPSTVSIKLKSPYAPFLDSVSQSFLGMVSPSAAKKAGADFGRHPNGTGPFAFKEWIPKDHLTLTRNEDYNWAPPSRKHQGPAYLASIQAKFIPEAASRLTSLQSGDVDFIDSMPEQDFQRIHADSQYRVVQVPELGLPAHMPLTMNFPPTDIVDVRRAISYAIDHVSLNKTVYFGLYEIPKGPLTKGTPGYTPKVEGLYPFDQGKAKQILDQAGWKAGNSGIREKDGKPLKLDFVAWTDIVPLATVVQAQLKQVGIQVDQKVFDQATFTAMARKGQTNLGFVGFPASDPSVLTRYFHSGSPVNRVQAKDPKLDKMLDEGMVTMDDTKRWQIYEDIQLYIMDQAMISPVYVFARPFASLARVNGYSFEASGAYPRFYDAFISK